MDTAHIPPVMPESEPTRLKIPAIDVSASSFIPLGLDPNGLIEVPSERKPMTLGWYKFGPTPGERGPAIVLGHVDGTPVPGKPPIPGVFFKLHELESGDKVIVYRKDGTAARFRVTEVQRVPKEEFPTQKVYGDTAGAELRLITCGGAFDRSKQSYTDNIIVYAKLDTEAPRR